MLNTIPPLMLSHVHSTNCMSNKIHVLLPNQILKSSKTVLKIKNTSMAILFKFLTDTLNKWQNLATVTCRRFPIISIKTTCQGWWWAYSPKPWYLHRAENNTYGFPSTKHTIYRIEKTIKNTFQTNLLIARFR